MLCGIEIMEIVAIPILTWAARKIYKSETQKNAIAIASANKHFNYVVPPVRCRRRRLCSIEIKCVFFLFFYNHFSVSFICVLGRVYIYTYTLPYK